MSSNLDAITNFSHIGTSSNSDADSTSSRSRYFQSRRLRKDDIHRPWLDRKDPRSRWQWILPTVGFGLGMLLCLYETWSGYRSVPNHKYCPVLMEDFSSGVLNTDVWTREVQVGGFGNGQFDMTTNDDVNSFIKDGKLWIKPTLQDASLIDNDNVLNLLGNGCTSEAWSDCVATTNVTNGTIVNPVKSARIHTKKGASIKYGRVEVVAKLPAGDWLWPAIWLLPVSETYGQWPASGEIDIVESRGNNFSYPGGGNQVMLSSLHWGPNSAHDGYSKTTGGTTLLRSTFSDDFHTFGLEWSEKYILTYLDKRLSQPMYITFLESFWNKGGFGGLTENNTKLVDPWSQTGRISTPFDQDFYLILNVAVGGTNGWFADGQAGKPWIDASPSAKLQFWQAKDEWYPTWRKESQMVVNSVKMWQQKGYNGC